MANPSKKRWILGVTGGIAAYKAPELVRLLVKNGAEVQVVLSKGAKQFVSSLSLQAVSKRPVLEAIFDERFEQAMGHIELARWADGILIAPITANRMAALALGFADDLLSTLVLASKAPLYIAPAMNKHMWDHPMTQQHAQTLSSHGATMLGPDSGEQACGDYGLGRMLEPSAIVDSIFSIDNCTQNLSSSKLNKLKDKTILITAGPTREEIDPVRYISNKSSGKMGFAVAAVAAKLGMRVILVSGPVSLPTPANVQRIDVVSCQDMLDAVMTNIVQTDIFVAAAAVADFKLQKVYPNKIKKPTLNQELQLTLEQNPDILAQVAKLENRPYCVGFAAETVNFEDNAKTKLFAKKLDMIALNNVKRQDIGFDVEDNELTVITNNKNYKINKQPKLLVAEQLIKLISEEYDGTN